MNPAVKDLLAILDLETIEVNLFRGRSPQVGWQRVFGGQVIGQALVAACRTVDEIADRPPHSLHGYFLLAGDPNVPIIYEVDRIRDGRSFTTRRVVAIQHGHAIFAMAVSFHGSEPGLSHQAEMRKVPGPEQLPSDLEIRQRILPMMPDPIRRYFERERPIELRPVEFERYLGNRFPDGRFNAWIRTTGALPDMAASLDHALWFHRPFRADEWLLYAQDSPSAAGARGFARGLIFTRDGTLVASVAQEGLLRERRER